MHTNRAWSLPIALVVLFVPAGACRIAAENMEVMLDRHARGYTLSEGGGLIHGTDGYQPRAPSPPLKETRPEEKFSLPEGVLTLEAARRIALRANPDIHAARARIETARARIAEAQAQYLPTLTAAHTSVRTFYIPASWNRLSALLQPAEPLPTDIDRDNLAVSTLLSAVRRPLFGLGKLRGSSSSFGEHSTSLAISWLVFDGFARRARVLAAEHLHRAARQSFADVERLIIQAVDAAYYRIQLADEQLRIARADEVFSREQLEKTKKLLAAGRATQADVDNFRVRVLAARTRVAAAIGSRETGRVVLAELMGLPNATLPDEIVPSSLSEESEEEMSVPDVGTWVERAMENRPDLARLRAILKSRKESVTAAKASFYPTIAVSGSWGFDRLSTIRYTSHDQSAAAALDLRWELYTGGARRARIRAAESKWAEAAAKLNRLRLAVQAEVRKAVIGLADARERIQWQRQNLETARENRRVIEAAYLAGKETLTRLNEAQRDFIEADASLALARIRLRQAWSDLHAAAATYRDMKKEETIHIP